MTIMIFFIYGFTVFYLADCLVMYLDVPAEFKPLILAQGRIGVGSDPGRVVVWVGSGMV